MSARMALRAYGRQRTGSWEDGHTICRLAAHPLGVDVLEGFLRHPHIIPEVWKGKLVFFWGTIYSAPSTVPGVEGAPAIPHEILYVRCLIFSGGSWKDDFLSLDDEFGPTRLSAEIYVPTLRERIKSFFHIS